MPESLLADLQRFIPTGHLDGVQLAADRAVTRAALPEMEPAGSFLAQAMQVKLDDRQFSIWNLRGYSAPYQLLIPAIVERIRGEEFKLALMDPLYKMLGDADENSATDIAGLLNSIEQVMECGPAAAFGAHFSKGNQAAKNSIDRISGSGVFARRSGYDPDLHGARRAPRFHRGTHPPELQTHKPLRGPLGGALNAPGGSPGSGEA